MRIKLKFAELHNPLFLAGNNLGTKLDIAERAYELWYERKEKELLVIFGKEVGIIPFASVATMVPVNPSDLEITITEPPKPEAPPIAAHRGKIKAQVSDPTRDAVFGVGN